MKKKESPERGAVVQRQAKLGLWNVPCGRYPLSPPLLLRFRLGFCWQNKPSSSGSVAPFPTILSSYSFASASCIVKGDDRGAPFLGAYGAGCYGASSWVANCWFLLLVFLSFVLVERESAMIYSI
ncbi:hypothetical protein CEXT_612131 [Caerostris extrusa]|uniref:Uncharacterized protein n=1 Tax=Caerostris extrusa TaxID=172846 RepID=A0AAV4MUB8_CAEEX|nr:hypothetical protein CEXT_612131 [Caerostris extrusa]